MISGCWKHLVKATGLRWDGERLVGRGAHLVVQSCNKQLRSYENKFPLVFINATFFPMTFTLVSFFLACFSNPFIQRSGYTVAAGGITLTIIRWGRATGLFFIESIESMLNRRSRITLERSLRWITVRTVTPLFVWSIVSLESIKKFALLWLCLSAIELAIAHIRWLISVVLLMGTQYRVFWFKWGMWDPPSP